MPGVVHCGIGTHDRTRDIPWLNAPERAMFMYCGDRDESRILLDGRLVELGREEGLRDEVNTEGVMGRIEALLSRLVLKSRLETAQMSGSAMHTIDCQRQDRRLSKSLTIPAVLPPLVRQ